MPADMTPRAVSTRLRRVDQLRRLCLALGRARIEAPHTPHDASEVKSSRLPQNRSGDGNR